VLLNKEPDRNLSYSPPRMLVKSLRKSMVKGTVPAVG